MKNYALYPLRQNYTKKTMEISHTKIMNHEKKSAKEITKNKVQCKSKIHKRIKRSR